MMNINQDDLEPMGQIISLPIKTQMQNDIYDYACAVIQDRALPDVFDGLKPVQRRILFAMQTIGNLPNAPTKKCARIVGEVLGKYHPHGDISVYDTLVNMAQDFKKRVPLIHGQGNFGSIDGADAAAMRYCFTADTFVMTENGLTTFKDMVEPEIYEASLAAESEEGVLGVFKHKIQVNVPSLDLSLQPATDWIYSGYHDVYLVDTLQGHRVQCTANEPLLTYRMDIKTKQFHKVWTKVENLREMDIVLLNRKPIEQKHLSAVRMRADNPYRDTSLYDMAVLLLQEKQQFNIDDVQNYLLSHSADDIMKFFIIYQQTSQVKKLDFVNYMMVRHDDLVHLFKQILINYFGVLSMYPKDFHNFRAEILNQHTKNNLPLPEWDVEHLEDVQILPISRAAPLAYYEGIDYIFSFEEDGKRLVEDYHEDFITHIEYIGKHDVYDLTVSNTHAFFANGLMAHNTEARLSQIAYDGMFQNINQNVVDFQPSYDGTETEPVRLPVSFPQLWVNGSSGVAVSVATEILPHNLSETIDVTLAYQNNPHISTQEILELMPSPDFPTGGVVFNLSGFADAIDTGRGQIKLRSTYEVEEILVGKRIKQKVLVIKEIPYKTNKENIFNAIQQSLNSKASTFLNDNVQYVQDETDKNGIRIALYLKPNAIPELVFNQLLTLKYQSKEGKNQSINLETTFNYNVVVLDENKRHQTVGLRYILQKFLDFRKDILLRKAQYELEQANKNLHLYSGFMVVLQDIQGLIDLIQAHANNKEAKTALQNQYGIDEIQAQEILQIRLQRLTQEELEEIKSKYQQLIEKVADLTDFIQNEKRIQQTIRDDLLKFKEKFGHQFPRKTQVSHEDAHIDMKDLIPNDSCVIILTKDGFIKRINNQQINSQNRNTKGKKAIEMRDDDTVQTIVNVNTHDYIIFFTASGKMYATHAWNVPEDRNKGKHIRHILERINEDIIDMVGISEEDFQREDLYLLTVSRLGKIKRTSMNAYFKSSQRKDGTMAVKLQNEHDALITCGICQENDHLMLVSSNSTVNRFEIDFKTTDKKTSGINGINLLEGEDILDAIIIPVSDEQRIYIDEIRPNYVPDENGDIVMVGRKYRIDGEKVVPVLDTRLIDENQFLLVMSENGVGKKVPLSSFKLQKRKAKGISLLKENEKTGKLIRASLVNNEQTVIITTQQKTVKIKVSDIPEFSRMASGNYLMKVDDDKVVDIAIVD